MGFDHGFLVANLPKGRVTGDHSFYFSVRLPEGNCRVTVTLGATLGASTNTVKAEARRLMLENLIIAPGEIAVRSFVVNTRTVNYPGGQVHLKTREKTMKP